MPARKLKATLLLVWPITPHVQKWNQLLNEQRADEMWLLNNRACKPAPFEPWGKRKNRVAMQRAQRFLGCRDALQMFSNKHVIKSYHPSSMRSVVPKTYVGWATLSRSTPSGWSIWYSVYCSYTIHLIIPLKTHTKENKFQSVSCIRSCRSESNRWRLSRASPSTRSFRGANLGKRVPDLCVRI